MFFFPPLLLHFWRTFIELTKFPDLILISTKSNSNAIGAMELGVLNFTNFSLSIVQTSEVRHYHERYEVPGGEQNGTVQQQLLCSWSAPIIFLQVDSSASVNVNQSCAYNVLSDIAKTRHVNHGEFNAPPGHPFIFVVLCSAGTNGSASDDTDNDNDDLISVTIVAKAIVPVSYQINSRVYLVTCQDIYEVYYIHQRLVIRRIEVVVGQDLDDDGSTIFRRRNFMQQNVVTTHARAWNLTTNSSKKAIQAGMSGGSYLLLGFMQDFLNLTVTILGSKDWYAMSDRVWAKECDFGLSATGMLASVTVKFRFLTTPTYTDYAIAYYSEVITPDELRHSQSSLLHLKPFQPEAWTMIALLALMLFICHQVIVSRDEMGDSFWLVLASLTLKSMYPLETKNSLRIMAFVGSFFGFILYAFYSAELISSLSTYKDKMYTLENLIHDKYTFGIINTSYLAAAQSHNDFGKDTIATRLYSQLDKDAGQVSGVAAGIAFVLHHQKYAFITDEAGVYETIEKTSELNAVKRERDARRQPLCSYFHAIPIPEYTVQQAPIVRKGAPFTEYFNMARARVYESGIWRMYKRRRESYASLYQSICPATSRIYFTLRDVLLPFYTLVIGLCISCISFLIETGIQVFGQQRRDGVNFKTASHNPEANGV